MPNRDTHLAVGIVAGLGAGAIASRRLPSNHQAIECIASAVGGAIGGLAPDVLEPAVSPNHRDLFHSLAVGGALSAAKIADMQATCRRYAADCDGRAAAAPVGSDIRSNEQLKALLWRIAAGLLIGFVAGYVSHLALDASTKRSVPLVTRGF
jgi:membrane-bound metal-dependent hydrolase YbcI (DUF457 family)